MDESHFAVPGLRFDKVAVRLIESVRSSAREFVPQNRTVVFTVTAPIRLPSKTAAAIESAIREALTRKSKHVELQQSIHGNDVGIWVFAGAEQTPNVLGFVHNPDVDPHALVEMARSR